MNQLAFPFARRCMLALLCFGAYAAHAEPYLAVQMGLKCGQCHVNPTGGGMRTTFGDIFAQTVLPGQHLDTGTDNWTGDLGRYLRIGGDLRFDASATQVPQAKTAQEFDVFPTRLYLEANVIPDRLIVYADEQVAPGGALNREAYGLFWSAAHDWYIKAGQMYLPFGLRLQDVSAFVQDAAGISMAAPDQGVEFGWERSRWDGQLAITNGTAAGPVNSAGKQYSALLSYVESRWRLGVAANFNAQSGGSKQVYGPFGGLRTGPIAWLAQAEVINDQSVANGLGRQLAALLEANWLIARGNNLKMTEEFLDPNRAVRADQQTRWSLVYEFTPVQFAQIRAGFRHNYGIPQDNSEHRRMYFVELHGYF